MIAWAMSWSWPTSCGGVRRPPPRSIPSPSRASWPRWRRAPPSSRPSPTSAAFATDDGLVLVDTGSQFLARAVHGRHPRLERPAAPHRRLLPRPHRPRLRRPRLRGGGRRQRGWARAAGRRPRGPAGPLRPLHPDRRLQRRHQPAPVPGAQPAVADGVPLPRRDLPRRAHASRSAASASSCTTPGARPTTTRGRGCRTARCSAAATCSSGPRPTPATRRRCSATRASGRPPCGTWPGSAPRCCCPATACPIVGADRIVAGAHRHGRAARVPARPDRRADERRAPASTRSSTPCRRPRTCWRSPTCARSTTSPSSWCATCGGSTAAGTTATRPTSSRRPRPRWPPSWPRWPAAPARWPTRALELAAAGDGEPAPGRPPGRAGRAGRPRRRRRARGPGRGLRGPRRRRAVGHVPRRLRVGGQGVRRPRLSELASSDRVAAGLQVAEVLLDPVGGALQAFLEGDLGATSPPTRGPGCCRTAGARPRCRRGGAGPRR